MTTLSVIINSAFREGNIVANGEVPTDAERTEALDILNNTIRAMYGHDLPIRFLEWVIPYPLATGAILADYPAQPIYRSTIQANPEVYTYPPTGVRMLVSSLPSATTIYLPYDPYDGARMSYVDVGQDVTLTISANGRYIEGASTKVIEPVVGGRNAPLEWFYRADLADWINIAFPLGIDDESPLPAEFDDLLMTWLALRLTGRYRKEPDATTIARNQEMKTKLSQRYRYEPTVIGQAREITQGVQYPEQGFNTRFGRSPYGDY